MLNTNLHLSKKVFRDDIDVAPTRDGFGIGTVEAGKNDDRVIVLCADLAESTRAEYFQKEFPNRFIEMGIAEQNMAALASGMASANKIPFIASYAAFNPGRNYEQIRTTIALNQTNVKVCGMHAGISVGPDGATHQMLEDIGMMRALPNMTVLVPCDAEEARKAVVDSAKIDKPFYIRFGRSAVPTFTTKDTPFEIGKSIKLFDTEKPEVAILSTGSLSYSALVTANELEKKGIETVVLHFHTVKPIDKEAIIEVAKRTNKIVTVEEHQIAGGFGSAVAEVLAENYSVPMRFIGIRDQFGQSGTPEELLHHYSLDIEGIKKAVLDILK